MNWFFFIRDQLRRLFEKDFIQKKREPVSWWPIGWRTLWTSASRRPSPSDASAWKENQRSSLSGSTEALKPELDLQSRVRSFMTDNLLGPKSWHADYAWHVKANMLIGAEETNLRLGDRNHPNPLHANSLHDFRQWTVEQLWAPNSNFAQQLHQWCTNKVRNTGTLIRCNRWKEKFIHKYLCISKTANIFKFHEWKK